MSASPSTSPSDDPFRAPEPPQFREPWDPGSIVYLSLLGGVLAGAILFRLNARRLALGRAGSLLLWVAVAYTLFSVAMLSHRIVDLERERAPFMARQEASHRAQLERVALRRKTIEAVRKSNEAMRRAGYDTDHFAVSLDELEAPPPFDANAILEERLVEERLFVFLLWCLLAIGGVALARLFSGAQFRRYQWALAERVPLGRLFRPAVGLWLGSWLFQIVAVVVGVKILSPR